MNTDTTYSIALEITSRILNDERLANRQSLIEYIDSVLQRRLNGEVKPEKESGEMQKTAPSLSESTVSKDSSESADHSGFVKAAMSPSGTLWHKWFDRMGERATPSVINATATLVIEERNLAITAARDSERERAAQLERILRDAVGSIKVNDAGDPIERACPWTVEWFHPARELLSLKRGETFTPTEGSTEYVRGFEAGTAFVIATQREGGSEITTVESQVSVSALPAGSESSCSHRYRTTLGFCIGCGASPESGSESSGSSVPDVSNQKNPISTEW